jgi:hypothetical protein
MTGNSLSIGRNHTLAHEITVTHFRGATPSSDCWRIDIRWNDGAWVYMTHDTLQEATEHARSLGWYPRRTS